MLIVIMFFMHISASNHPQIKKKLDQNIIGSQTRNYIKLRMNFSQKEDFIWFFFFTLLHNNNQSNKTNHQSFIKNEMRVYNY
jgi:hypothetical protein